MIESLEGDQITVERLHEMGFRLGTKMVVLGWAPFRGPILVRYKSTLLALREEEAQCTQVRICNDSRV